jgi:NAD-dependent deacetylase
MSKKHLVILSGAGISAESGIKTFRDSGGLWEGHDVMEVASPEGWRRNRSLVQDFYNQRRKQLLECEPNQAHKVLAELEKDFKVSIITQNVDDLHERAGSSNVVHLHGELFKVRSTGDDSLVLDWRKDLCLGDNCKGGHQLRPHIVWFGEEVPLLPSAAASTREADIVLIIGTSMQVYPAAGLVHYAPPNAPIYFIDPRPSITESDYRNLTIIPERAAIGVPILTADLIDKAS